MKRELDYFTIEGSLGGNQDWFRDYMMKIGGCAAVTACDSCIYFDRQSIHDPGSFDPSVAIPARRYPFDLHHLSIADYRRFGRIMKPYLRPRMRGIDRLDIYMDGFGAYLADVGADRPRMEPFDGHEPYAAALSTIQTQLDDGFPVPILMLHHHDPALDFYEWHWFLLTGYDRHPAADKNRPDEFLVKAVTYGSGRWLNLASLWDTGYEERGGLILYR